MKHIRNLCNRNVVHIDPEASVLDAAHLMRARHVGDVVVVESNHGILKPVGMLTDRDIVTLIVGEDLSPDSIRVSDVMAHHPEVIEEFEELLTAIERMSEAGVRRLPVVDERGSLVGIVTADDMLQVLTRLQTSLAAISSQQMVHEMTGATLINRFT